MQTTTTSLAPGEGLKTQKMPGHWVLARLGKRVLRPGGMQFCEDETTTGNTLDEQSGIVRIERILGLNVNGVTDSLGHPFDHD